MIKVYGYLKKRFPEINKHDIRVKSVSEAIKALDANFPGFRNAIKKDGKYVIRRGDTLKHGKDVPEEELEMEFSDKCWHILPVPAGYGGKGVVQTIIGAAITAVGIVMAYFPPTAAAAPYVISLGLGVMFGGMAQMFAPSPGDLGSGKERPDERPSYLFNGPTNSLSPGLTIPVAYGKTFIGSIVASGGLEIVDI